MFELRLVWSKYCDFPFKRSSSAAITLSTSNPWVSILPFPPPLRLLYDSSRLYLSLQFPRCIVGCSAVCCSMPLSVLTFPGSSPSRDLPNPHPYGMFKHEATSNVSHIVILAIKTSSSAVLTRSNSTGHRSTSHHYTPISPCKNPIGIKESRYVSSHKHTSSLPSGIDDPRMTPPPVHMPPSSTLPARLANQGPPKGESLIVSEGEGIPPTPPLTWRVKRSETLPSVFPNRSDTEISVQDLPVGCILL